MERFERCGQREIDRSKQSMSDGKWRKSRHDINNFAFSKNVCGAGGNIYIYICQRVYGDIANDQH